MKSAFAKRRLWLCLWIFAFGVFHAGPAFGASPSAAGDRPSDAPWILSESPAPTPPLPAEYLTQEDGWLKLEFHPSARERVRALSAQAEAARKELIEKLGSDVLGSVSVRIAAVPAEMARLSPTEPSSYASGLAFSDRDLIVMSLASPLSLEPPKAGDVLRHLLAHLALDQAVKRRPLPAWFHEGFAVHTAGDALSVRTQNLCAAATMGRLIRLEKLPGEMPADAPQSSLAYAEAADFLRFLLSADTKSNEKFPRLIRAVREGETLDQALAQAYGTPLSELEQAWRRDMAKRYGFLPVMLASTLLWAIALSIFAAKRARQKQLRKASLTPQLRRNPSEGEVNFGESRAPARVFSALRMRERRSASRIEDDAMHETPIVPEPEIPKVKHEGEWHTLH